MEVAGSTLALPALQPLPGRLSLRDLLVRGSPAEVDWVPRVRQLRLARRAIARSLAGRAARDISRALGPGHPFFAAPPDCCPRTPRVSANLAEARLARAGALAPDEDGVLEWTGRREASRGRLREALGLFRRLAVRGRSAHGRAAGLAGAGEVALARGRVREAVRLLRRSLAAHPGSCTARVRLAVALALLPDPASAAAAFARLDRFPDEAPEIRAAIGATPAFARLLAARPDWSARFRQAAPRLLADPPQESAAACAWADAALSSAEAWIERASVRAGGARSFLRKVLVGISRATGHPKAVLLRDSDRGLETLASVPAGGPADRSPRAPEPALPGAVGEEGVEARIAAPPLLLLLRSPHAWRIGDREARFVEGALERIQTRLVRGGERERGGLLSGLPLRLRGRSAALVERIPGSDRMRILERAGRAGGGSVATLSPPLLRRFEAFLPSAPGVPGLGSAELGPDERLDPASRAGFAVSVPYAGAAAGALIVESARRDLGERERERAARFAAAMGDRLRAAQFRGWVRGRFSDEVELPTSGAGARLAASLARAARSGGPVLLVGETGSGKEVFARYFHFETGRAAGPFVPYPCGSSPSPLVEAELFGFSRGAFTGAERGSPGFLERATGGTLFLDEVSALSVETQARLLRVLERGAVRRLGEAFERPADFRLVASTQVDLAAAGREGRFRQDLFQRLARFRLLVPPLRERREEIPALVRCVAARFAAREGRSAPKVGPDAIALLWRQEWRGNARELEAFLVRCFLIAGGAALDGEGVRRTADRFSAGLRERMPLRGREQVAAALRTARAEGGPLLGRSAELLGCHPDTVRRTLRALGLDGRALASAEGDPRPLTRAGGGR
ncbi:MAG TPA: sigma 54-interacting transcriptional regulator [Planctomycetota bacterium]|jgi:DNA-binding NtrC family response regulator|nr:sigma 54-interacting transcriptional regulator [Planctomycetota bacterium]